MIEDDNKLSSDPHNEVAYGNRNEGFKTETEQKIYQLLKEEEQQKTRTFAHYEKMRKDNPHRYLSDKSLQKQMISDAIALGDAFYV
jgi:hypothetical protein